MAPAVFTTGAFCAPAAFATALEKTSPVKLTFSHFLSSDSYFETDLIAPWARQLEAATDGQVSVSIVSGSDPTGEVTQQAANVERGLVDIALGLCGAQGQRMPGSSLIELPMLVADAASGSRMLWRLLEEGTLADDYRGFKPLALFVHNPGVIHTLNRRVSVPADMQGLRLRVPNRAVAVAVEQLGATPRLLQVNDVMPAVHSGQLDGVITNWGTPLPGFYDTHRHHTDIPFYTSAFFIVMNLERFESLPRRIQRAIEGLCGRTLVDRIAGLWDRWDGAGFQRASQPGHEIIRPAGAEEEVWRRALLPAIDEYLDELSPTFSDARRVFERVKTLSAMSN